MKLVPTTAEHQIELLTVDVDSPELTVLSYGAGQDSTAILLRYLYDASFRAMYAPKRFLVVMADTGDEHDDTIAHVHETERLCRQHGVDFEYLTFDRGYHRGAWAGGLLHQYETHDTIGSVAYPKTCTMNLKVEPIYRFLEEWVATAYSLPSGGKRALRAFAARYGQIRVLLGIAAGEERRVSTGQPERAWMRTAIRRVYPLIDLGMDRAACQAYITAVGHHVPPPSNCYCCPYKRGAELVWSARRYPQRWAHWVELERRKLTAWEGRTKKRNLGVKGTTTLIQALAKAEREFGHLAEHELDAYRMTHGHCTNSSY